MQVVRSRTRPRKYGQNPRKMEATKDLKASKNANLKQNIDASSINNTSYQTENAGYITPLPPPLVSTCRCLNSIKKWFSCLCTNYITQIFLRPRLWQNDWQLSTRLKTFPTPLGKIKVCQELIFLYLKDSQRNHFIQPYSFLRIYLFIYFVRWTLWTYLPVFSWGKGTLLDAGQDR